VRRFLLHWRPHLAVFAESELWPNLILGASEAGVKLALVSAKVSETSLAGWRRWPAAIAAMLGSYDLVLAQDARSAARLQELGRDADGLADLKYGADPLPYDADGLAQIRAHTGSREIAAAVSTHPGEDAIVLQAFAQSGEADSALLIIAPRHPERGPDIARMAEQSGLSAALRSRGDPPGAARVYVADTLGEVGIWLRLARVAFIGGSLVPGIGGHNPLEPARLGCPACAGPHVENWRSAYDDLIAAEGLEVVADAAALSAVFDRSTMALHAMAARANERVSARDADARRGLDRILALVP
jgi:3-deoxy-D-manno-octulosonic-acid transferase